MKTAFKYTGVHDYLDALFAHRNGMVSDEEIKKAKEDYLRLYQKHYQHGYYDKHVRVWCTLNSSEHQLLKQETGKYDLSISKYLRRMIQNTITEKVYPTPPIVKQWLLEVRDLIEEADTQQEVVQLSKAFDLLDKSIELL